jgi:hypothetical protein
MGQDKAAEHEEEVEQDVRSTKKRHLDKSAHDVQMVENHQQREKAPETV